MSLSILLFYSEQASVAKWVVDNNYWINTLPQVDDLVGVFLKIKNELTIDNKVVDQNYFSIENFVHKILNNENAQEIT